MPNIDDITIPGEAAVKVCEGQSGFAENTTLTDVARQIAQEHLIDGFKETLDAPAPAWMPRRGKDEAQLDVGGDLLEVDRGEVAAVIRVEHVGDPKNDPMDVSFPPDRLAQCQRRVKGRRSSNERKYPATARL